MIDEFELKIPQECEHQIGNKYRRGRGDFLFYKKASKCVSPPNGFLSAFVLNQLFSFVGGGGDIL
jgi:hypothetical protein